MAHSDDKRIYVSVFLQGEGFVPAGTILFNDVMNYAGFVYFKSYADNNYPPLNPGTLNYQTQKTLYFPVDVRTNPDMIDRTFWELLPSQGDFGTSVLISRYPEYFSMTNAQKLYFLGSRVVGGLSCYVDKQKNEQSIIGIDWLDEIRRESVAFFTKQIASMKNSSAFDVLTSYGGVRPKAMFRDDQGGFWIAKFNLPSDPYNMARAEHLAITMAKDCGLHTPETKVLTLPSGEDVFLTKRFDRNEKQRFHGLSFFAVAPAIDFERQRPAAGVGHSAQVMGKLVSRFSEHKKSDQEATANKLLVDIGFNNTDNHLRNSRFILGEDNKWTVSPTFDVIFDPRDKPHTYSPAGLSRQDTYLNNEEVLVKIAGFCNLPVETVAKMAEKTRLVCENWEEYALDANLSTQDMMKIENAMKLGSVGPVALANLEEQKRKRLFSNLPKMKMN